MPESLLGEVANFEKQIGKTLLGVIVIVICKYRAII